MKPSLPIIPLENLAIAFIPVLISIAVLYRWSLNSKTALYAVARMLLQLMLIGYALTFIFKSDSSYFVLAVLAAMLLMASWISLHHIRHRRKDAYFKVLGAIVIGGVSTLILITQFVLDLEVWFQPHFVIPIAGMIFANSMNAVSIAAERFESETGKGDDYLPARNTALRASLIPLINSLFAVGLVSIPGMMTGQILSGVDPLVAARYQIMVMCMIFGSASISAICYLVMLRPKT
jgi:putative ABC transport system permease protein